jgi:hypothetical protein
MVEIEVTNDAVRLSFLQAILTDAGIQSFVFDADTPWPGVMHKRLLVAEPDAAAARRAVGAADRA